MADPITWRSLMNVQMSDAARPMLDAGLLLNNGFDRLQKAVTDQQAVNQGIQDRGEEALVLGFKEALARAKTPEEAAALQGQLDAQRAQMGNRGRTAVLGAEEARQGVLRTNVAAERLFKDNSLEYDNRGVVQQAMALGSEGKTKEALALLAPLANTLPRFGEHVTAINNGGRAIATHTLNMAKTYEEIAASQAGTEIARGNLRVNQQNASTNALNARTQEMNTMLQRLQVSQEQSGKLSTQLAASAAGVIGTEGGQKALVEQIGSVVKDPTQAERLVAMASTAIRNNPEFANLPTSVVLAEVLKNTPNLKDSWLTPETVDNNRIRLAIEGGLTAALADPSLKSTQDRRAQADGRTIQALTLNEGVQGQLLGRIFPNMPRPTPAAVPARGGTTGVPAAPGEEPAGGRGPIITAGDRAAAGTPVAPPPAPTAGLDRAAGVGPQAADAIVTVPGPRTRNGGTAPTYRYNGKAYSTWVEAAYARESDDIERRKEVARENRKRAGMAE